MQLEGAGGPAPDFTAESLLNAAEQAFLRAEFQVVRPLLQRVQGELGLPGTEPVAVRYDALLGALAARAGNWAEAVRRCPEDLDEVATGVLHAFALNALRELGKEGRHTDAGIASVAIVLWAYLLDEEDPGDFRALLTERRGAPVADALWGQGLARLRDRISGLLHALDVRDGRDDLTAWRTAWQVQLMDPTVVPGRLPTDAGPHALVDLDEAAWHLIDEGRGGDLLTAFTARHPDLGTWPTELPGHRTCAIPLARALATRGTARVQGGKWSEALADFGTAVRLGHTLPEDERAAVRRAGNNVGRSRTGVGNSPLVRIEGLEQARALLPGDTALAAELAAELVRQGREIIDSNPAMSRGRFARALTVTPGHPDARAGLDDLLRADLRRALNSADVEDGLDDEAVRDLLKRDPDCAAARMWLEDHYAALAVSAAVRGQTADAQHATHAMLVCVGPEDSHDAVDVDEQLVDLLVAAADGLVTAGNRDALEHRVELLHTALTLSGPACRNIRKALDTALLDLVEHLETAAPPSAVIELFLRDLMRTGTDGRFDRVVEAAYLHRARDREGAGDPGGARRDRDCAERIGAGMPPQVPLFGPALRPSGRADLEQDTLF
ncbi:MULTISPECIES: hypothetical protein [unclassified Streptomyces]|uniref:hypothetical protein n=1 Tax=unclassified Streptomyces TaxID=2593676 RepID=UPI000DADF360|nr:MULTISPECIES: hypothetical protein [unclassified Streptomyces]PZT77510.1 hypothetical protein DNK56_30495 [Streptomyces sp. AC1-42W]PZT78535.1 hypothetical protein DNK55_02185 [Streptomyces sp. AC1-42T]